MNIVVLILSAVGFAVSLYAYCIEERMSRNPEYKPACDISNSISCSRAFKSKYSKLFGIANSVAGMIFYAIVFASELLSFSNAIFYYAIAAVGGSIIFAYLLYVKIKSFCLVCTMIYIINISLLLATLRG